MSQPLRLHSATKKFQSKLVALLVIAAAVALSALVSMRLDTLRYESALRVRRAYDRILTYDGLLAAILDAETSMRGYLLTQDRTLLAPYNQAMMVIEERIRATHGHGLADQTRAVEQHVREAVHLIQGLIEQPVRSDAGVLYRRLMQARRAMDVVRTDLDRLQLLQLQQRDQASANRLRYGNLNRWTNVLTSLTAAIFLCFLAVWFRRDLRLEETQGAQIREQASSLRERQRHLEQLAQQLAQQNEVLIKVNHELAIVDGARVRAIESLQRRNRDLEQFAYITSHDLKAPLRAIGNISDWIEEDLGPSAPAVVLGHLATMKQRVARMNALIEGILTYSKAGRSTTQESVQVLDALVNVTTLLGISEQAWLFHGDNVALHTDRTQFEQVLQNLVGNAVKHGPSDLPVEVRCRVVDENVVEMSVRDHGPGIDPRFHGKVFEIFQTLARRDKLESTGIGMAIVKKIVTTNGGSVWLDSALGQGANFLFTWPRRLGNDQDRNG